MQRGCSAVWKTSYLVSKGVRWSVSAQHALSDWPGVNLAGESCTMKKEEQTTTTLNVTGVSALHEYLVACEAMVLAVKENHVVDPKMARLQKQTTR
eukprot:7500090-Pyramimonas_sp.AAC.1